MNQKDNIQLNLRFDFSGLPIVTGGFYLCNGKILNSTVDASQALAIAQDILNRVQYERHFHYSLD